MQLGVYSAAWLHDCDIAVLHCVMPLKGTNVTMKNGAHYTVHTVATPCAFRIQPCTQALCWIQTPAIQAVCTHDKAVTHDHVHVHIR